MSDVGVANLSPPVNPQSFCSSALTWIYRFVWVFRSAAWVSKFTSNGDLGLVDLVILQQCRGQEAEKRPGVRTEMGFISLLIKWSFCQTCPLFFLHDPALHTYANHPLLLAAERAPPKQCGEMTVSPVPQGSLTVVVKEAVSCCFTFSTHISPAGAWILASKIPVTSMCPPISSRGPTTASNRSLVRNNSIFFLNIPWNHSSLLHLCSAGSTAFIIGHLIVSTQIAPCVPY